MPYKPLPKHTIFVSYCVDDQRFVHSVCNILKPYLGESALFLFKENPSIETGFLTAIQERLEQSEVALFFVGQRFGDYQKWELMNTVADRKGKKMVIVGIHGQRQSSDLPEKMVFHAADRHFLADAWTGQTPPNAAGCAKSILGALRDWISAKHPMTLREWNDSYLLHGLPRTPQLFSYEKDMIGFYVKKRKLDAEASRLDAPNFPELDEGVPADWPPDVERLPRHMQNPLDKSQFRDTEANQNPRVRSAALVKFDAPEGEAFTFPEAGPRRQLAFPVVAHAGTLNVAIIVAGGIAPGINAVIDAIVQRHCAYRDASGKHKTPYDLKIYGVKNGFLSLKGGAQSLRLYELTPLLTREYATRGGSMIGTSRDEEMLKVETRHSRLLKAAQALNAEGRVIDIAYIIGGDGSMKAAHALWHITNKTRQEAVEETYLRNRPLSVVTVPKTMDNDILWVWQSFGFLSAVDESRKIVETLHTEVRSNPRLGIVQLFGSDSGFVVSHAVLAAAAGHASLALIPEVPFSVIGVALHMKEKLAEEAARHAAAGNEERRNRPDFGGPIDPLRPHGLIVLAETAIPEDALLCLGIVEPDSSCPYAEVYRNIAAKFRLLDDERRAIEDFVTNKKNRKANEGQTTDPVRELGLHIMKVGLEMFIKSEKLPVNHPGEPPRWSDMRVLCSEPRHLVRALEPSTSDIISGQRLGVLAVDAAMAGYTDCMVSQWLTEFALVPLELVVLGRKRIPPSGMFWKSVVNKTGQPVEEDGLVDPYDPKWCPLLSGRGNGP